MIAAAAVAHGLPITGPGPVIEAWIGVALAALLVLVAAALFVRLLTGDRR